MKFYAVKWTYGRAVDSNGNRCGTYFVFGSKTERDEWCDAGPAYTGEAGYREPVKASDSELRKILRYDTLRYEADGQLVF